MKRWRLIVDGGQSGQFNMAADAFLLSSSENSSSCPTLRIYDWDKPTITIGYHQHLDNALDRSRLGSTPVVRRITGGRALFHNDQALTYAVAGNFSSSPELGQSIKESYIEISRAIANFYHAIGIEVCVAQRDRPVVLSSTLAVQKDCFSAVSRWEITSEGRKLAAGSQRRTKTAIMQHGVIIISPSAGHPALRSTTQLNDGEEVLSDSTDRSKLTKALSDAFSMIYGVAFDSKPFTPAEIVTINQDLNLYRNLNRAENLIEQ